jgi:hypothetical protein
LDRGRPISPGRDYFHNAGTWNLNLGMYKNTRITERTSLQLRLEAYNAFNHANYSVNTGAAYVYGCSTSGCASGRLPDIQLGAK